MRFLAKALLCPYHRYVLRGGGPRGGHERGIGGAGGGGVACALPGQGTAVSLPILQVGGVGRVRTWGGGAGGGALKPKRRVLLAVLRGQSTAVPLLQVGVSVEGGGHMSSLMGVS